MPVEAPTPLVKVMRVKETRKKVSRVPRSNVNSASLSSGKGSPRWMISRSAWDMGVKNICIATPAGLTGALPKEDHELHGRPRHPEAQVHHQIASASMNEKRH